MSDKNAPVAAASLSYWAIIFNGIGMSRLYEIVKKECPNLDPFLSGIFGGAVVTGVKSAYDTGFGSKKKQREENIRKEEQAKRKEDEEARKSEDLDRLVQSIRSEFLTLVQGVEARISTGLVETNSEIKVLRETMSFKLDQVQNQQLQQQGQIQKIQFQQSQQQEKQLPPPPNFSKSCIFPSLPKQQQIALGKMVLNGISKIFRK